MKTVLVIVLLVLVAVVILGCLHRSPLRKTRLNDNPYAALRSKAFAVTATQLGLANLSSSDLFGIIIDWHVNPNSATIVAFSTGDASIYLASGQVYVGGFNHPDIVGLAKRMIVEATPILKLATKSDGDSLSPEYEVRFLFRTPTGNFCFFESYANLKNGSSAASKLFNSANELMTLYLKKAGE